MKLYNKKTGQTAVCERENWTTCRDHMNAKGWIIYTPAAELTAARKEYLALIDGVIDESLENTVTLESYNTLDSMVEYPENEDNRQFSEDYNTRAAYLRDKITRDIRVQGLGSNFEVQSPTGPVFSDEYMNAWREAGSPKDFEFTGENKYENGDVWKGNCISCGAKVANYGSRGWEHTILYSDGTSENVTYCPLESSGYVDESETVGEGRDE